MSGDTTTEFPRPGEGWRHYRGGLYRIEAIAHNTTNGNAMVVYRGYSHHDQGVWARPLDEFVGFTDDHKRRFYKEREDING
jgi:hypothetical protein